VWKYHPLGLLEAPQLMAAMGRYADMPVKVGRSALADGAAQQVVGGVEVATVEAVVAGEHVYFVAPGSELRGHFQFHAEAGDAKSLIGKKQCFFHKRNNRWGTKVIK